MLMSQITCRQKQQVRSHHGAAHARPQVQGSSWAAPQQQTCPALLPASRARSPQLRLTTSKLASILQSCTSGCALVPPTHLRRVRRWAVVLRNSASLQASHSSWCTTVLQQWAGSNGDFPSNHPRLLPHHWLTMDVGTTISVPPWGMLLTMAAARMAARRAPPAWISRQV